MTPTRRKPPPDHSALTAMAFRIRARREELGMGQETLARVVGCSAYAIRSYELSERFPPIEKVAALCHALDMTPNQLFGWEEEP